MKQQVSQLRICEFIFSLTLTLLVLSPSLSRGQTINVSLNVLYSDPINSSSGGTWELVAKSSHFGISGLVARLTNITSSQNRGPRATVNGGDPAGFSVFSDFSILGYRELLMGQVPIIPLPSGKEQSVFYGVGTLINGAPNYPGKPAGTNSVGPAFTSLTNPQEIPWATGDVFSDLAWSTAGAWRVERLLQALRRTSSPTAAAMYSRQSAHRQLRAFRV